jgi:hypothetical protein
LSDRLHVDEFLTQLAYLGDVFSHLNDLDLGLQGLSAIIFNVRNKLEAIIKKLELFSACINKDTGHRSFRHSMIFYVCKWTWVSGQCQMWYSKAPEWAGCAITQVLSVNGRHKQLESLSLSCPASSPLTDIWTRVSSKLQQAVLWKLNLFRSHCQISGLGCAQSFLPWQITLLRHWCLLQPRTYVRVDSRPSPAWKLNTGTDCVWEMI